MTYSLMLGRTQTTKFLPRITNIKDRFNHAYVLGKTGMGKSVLMERMAKYDIDYGCAVCYIDPKGKHARKLASITPPERLVYVSVDSPIQINPLRKKNYPLSTIIAEFVQILDILVTLTASNPESTVLMHEIISMALPIFTHQQRDIAYLSRFLIYDQVRTGHLQARGIDPGLREYWTEFDALQANRYPKNKDKQESAKRVASRLLRLLTDDFMKNLACKENELDIADIVENKKVLLVDTSRMTYDKRIYLSNLIIYAILSYIEFEASEPRPFMVYVDEFQTIASKLFSDLLARARDYQVGFTLAHHDFKEITEQVLSSVLGNVSSFIIFRCGESEAKRMATLFGIKDREFLDMKNYYAQVRLGNKNIPIRTFLPFEGLTFPPPDALEPEIETHPRSSQIGEPYFLKPDCWFPV